MYKRTKEHIEKNRQSIIEGYRLRGRKPVFLGEKRPEHSLVLKKYYKSGRMKPIKMLGKNNPSWKGDKVSYAGLHHWIKKELGKPNECKICQTKQTKRYEWAMIEKKFTRNPSNWISLCGSCHRYLDGNGRIKGTQIDRLTQLKNKYSSKVAKIDKILFYLNQ